ncbi:MAG: hypothetical protein R3266_14065, partial [Gemmatimonadota bacterium]|nr:hypothetical protein [Gemmatimonadota bacterium]
MSEAIRSAAAPSERESDAGSGPVKVLLRLSGEIATKSRRTRSRFQDRLTRNLRDALDAAGVAASVEQQWSRIFVEAEGPAVLDV